MSGVTGAVIGGAVIGAGASIYSSSKAAGATRDASRESNAEIARQYDQTREDFAPYRAAGTAALSKLSRLYGLGTAAAAEPMSFQDFLSSRGGLASFGFGSGGGPLAGSLEGISSANNAYQEYLKTQPVTINGATGQVENTAPDMSVFTESPDYQFNLAEGQRAIDRSLASRGRALSGAGVRAGVRYASGMASNEFGNFYNRLASIAGLGQTATGSTAAAGSNAASQIGANMINAGNARASAYTAGAQGVNSSIQGGIGNLALLKYLQPGSA